MSPEILTVLKLFEGNDCHCQKYRVMLGNSEYFEILSTFPY